MALPNAFLNLLKSEVLTDVTLHVNGSKFPTHKCILSAWSPVFAAMFTSGMRETSSADITLMDMKHPAVFGLVLRFLYGAEFSSIVSVGNAMEIAAIANRFDVEALQVHCEEYIGGLLDVKNCCRLFAQSDAVGCDRLGTLCCTYAAHHYEDVSRTVSFRDLTPPLLTSIVGMETLAVRSEEFLFTSLVDWAENWERLHVEQQQQQQQQLVEVVEVDKEVDKEEGEQDKEKKGNAIPNVAALLRHVRFPLMSGSFIVRHVEPSIFMRRHPHLMRELLYEAYRHLATVATSRKETGSLVNDEEGRTRMHDNSTKEDGSALSASTVSSLRSLSSSSSSSSSSTSSSHPHTSSMLSSSASSTSVTSSTGLVGTSSNTSATSGASGASDSVASSSRSSRSSSTITTTTTTTTTTATNAGNLSSSSPSFRLAKRDNEIILFGGMNAVGHLGDTTGSISETHPVIHIRQRDNRYWLPSNPDTAFVCVELAKMRQVTTITFRNRHSKTHMLHHRKSNSEAWKVLVPTTSSGGYRELIEIDLNTKNIFTQYIKFSFQGRPNHAYHTSVFWIEVKGR